MNAASLQTHQPGQTSNRLQAVTDAVYLGLCFLVPLSAAGISVGFGLLAILWLLQGRFRMKWAEIVGNPLYLTVLAFFLLHGLGLLWTNQPVNGFKSWMIFLIPVWATVVSREVAHKGIYAFVAGMMVAEAGVYYKLWRNWEAYIQGGYSNDFFLAMGHISYNPMLALTIAFLLSVLMAHRLRGWRLALSLFFILAMTANMFLTGGRAGQVALLFAGGFLAVYYFRRRPLHLVVTSMVIGAIFWGGYQLSPVFQQRIDRAVFELKTYQENADTSVGQRLTFAENSLALFKESPWIGHGTGSFAAAYARINQVRSPEMAPTSNPHNYHSLILVQFGALGMLLYLLIYYQQLRLAWRLPANSELRPLALLLPAFVFLINFSDSYLWGHYTQALFALLMASLYRRDASHVA